MKAIWNRILKKVTLSVGAVLLLSLLFGPSFTKKAYAEEYLNPYVISIHAADLIEGVGASSDVSKVAMEVKLYQVSKTSGNDLGISFDVKNGKTIYRDGTLGGGTNTIVYSEAGENEDGIINIYNVPEGTYKIKFDHLYPESAENYSVSWASDVIEFVVSDSTVDANKVYNVELPVNHVSSVSANVYNVGNHTPFTIQKGYFKTESGKVVTFTDLGVSEKVHKYQYAELKDLSTAIPDEAIVQFGTTGEEKVVLLNVPDMKWTFVPTSTNPFSTSIDPALLSGVWSGEDTQFFGNVLNYCDYGLTKIEKKGENEVIDATFSLAIGTQDLALEYKETLNVNGVTYKNVYVVTGFSDQVNQLKTVSGSAYIYYPVAMNVNGKLVSPDYQLTETATKEKYQLLTEKVKLNTPALKESDYFDPLTENKQTVQPLKDAAKLYSSVNVIQNNKAPITKVEIFKADAVTGESVAGAVLTIYKKSDIENGVPKAGAKFIDQWETKAGMKRIIPELPEGETYVIIESQTPAGYISTAPVEFTVLSKGTVTPVVVPNKKTCVRVEKWDATNDKILPGVKLQILDAKGNVIDEWVSSDVAHEVVGKLSVGVKYTLHEFEPLKGYEKVEDSIIVLNQDGTLDKGQTTATIKSEEQNLIVVKNTAKESTDVNGNSITDSNGSGSGEDGKGTGYVKTGDENKFMNLYFPVILSFVVLSLLILVIYWDRKELEKVRPTKRHKNNRQ